MPILPPEPDIYPDTLLDESEQECDSSDVWWALYTMARREKELMRRLRRLEIPYYCPLIKRRVRSPSGRVRVSHVPLFSSYVFLHGTNEQRQKAMTTNCISRCLEIPDGRQLTHDLRQIQQLIRLDAPLTPEARLEPGERVRIRSGAMVGLEGVVIKRHGQERLLVAVVFLQNGASVLIEDIQVEQI